MSIKRALDGLGLFKNPGAWVLVDGQYGSTGKGLMASVLAEHYADAVDVVTSNAGPNSGHTSYFEGTKVVLCQLPTFGVMAGMYGGHPDIYMNGGAVIDPHKMYEEVSAYLGPENEPMISKFAAVVTEDAKRLETHLAQYVGSTAKGTGGAIASKVMRNMQSVVAGHDFDFCTPVDDYDFHKKVTLVEVSQGYSLGINSGFYPYCTSRECTVMQALADARINPRQYQSSIMVVRTYPIRVGGNSGPCYPDQQEISWDVLGIPPEKTTVTNKDRRLFTWSDIQFREALRVNQPRVIMLNFCNYLKPGEVDKFVEEKIIGPYREMFGRLRFPVVLLGFGPHNEDVVVYE